MPDLGQQVKRGRKFDQVLRGARDVFMADGFEGASVDDIARAAGVSKATLYSYFPDKRLLFTEVAKAECGRQADQAVESIDPSLTAAEVLRKIAEQTVEFVTSDFGQGMFRMCVAESERFPELGREFYASGPLLVRQRLVEFFQEANACGQLAVGDLDLAADQFQELCKADLFARFIFHMDKTFTDTEKARVIDGAVSTFLARYGP